MYDLTSRVLHCEAQQHAGDVVVTTQHVLEYRGKALFMSRKVWRVDDMGVLHGDIQIDVASDIPEPRALAEVHLAETPENVHWLGLGPHENYPDRKLAAQQGRWTLPLEAMHTPYIFPTENGLRCDTRELVVGTHQLNGRFHFSVSRYSQQQLRETTHHHLLREEPGCWLNSMRSIWAWVATTPGAPASRRSSSCRHVSFAIPSAGSRPLADHEDAATERGRSLTPECRSGHAGSCKSLLR